MPPIRTVSTPIKPMKTERTHEENQERAYIAASRRSDRSLEARIESARRASEIHKKRTGRGLRVTEQDVINEEMYEEEDDDIPSQYQRLSAHLLTGSLQFNRRLQDYIATQAAVRESFFAQYNQPPFNSLSQRFTNTGGPPTQTMNHFMNQPMPPPQPQGFAQASPSFDQPSHPSNHPTYRSVPYSVPDRPPGRYQPHQRSASMSIPQEMQGYQQPTAFVNGGVSSSQAEEQRRMSLPPKPLEKIPVTFTHTPSRPSLSRSTTSQSIQNANLTAPQMSPQHSTSGTPRSPHSTQSTPVLQTTPTPGSITPTGPLASTVPYADHFFRDNNNFFSLSMPPESQQLIAQGLNPSDPMAATFMQGSEHIALPTPTYTYNPNLPSKASRATNSNNASKVAPESMSRADTFMPPGAYLPFNTGSQQFMKTEATDDLSTASPASELPSDMFSSSDLLYDFGFGNDLSVANDNFDDLFNFDQQ